MMEIMKDLTMAERVRAVASERFAWPGGYAMGILTDDGGCLCSACVESEQERILADLAEGYKGSGFYPAAAYVSDADDDAGEWNDEQATVCDHCGRPVTDATTVAKP